MRAGLPLAIRRRLVPNERYGLRAALLGVAVVLVAVPFASLLFQVISKGALTRIDGELADGLNEVVHRSPASVTALEIISFFGRPIWFFPLVGAVAYWMWRIGRRRLTAFLIVTCLGGGIVNSAVKILVDRPRPIVDHPVHTAFGKSFPSGHSFGSVVCYGALLLVLLPTLQSRRARRGAVVAVVALCLAIGSSRLLLGVHFLSDVIAGFVLALAWLTGAVAVFEVWRTEEGRRPIDPLAEGVEPEAAADLRESLPAS
ncbi:MAG TPA: phosphatase PAP2 family protein [Acidimicrobiales bacterium]|jgi:membrane-associated phospholipid phosphatase|nr:phosphatase PAP2 family protein [Acidimicrobiales bacterium]